MINVLIVTERLNFVCGVTNHIKNLVNGLCEEYDDFKFVLLCGSVESNELIAEFKCKVIIKDNILHSKRNIANFIKSLCIVKSIVKTHNINLIHSHNHYGANLAYYSTRLTKIKTIQTNHGFIPNVGLLKHFKADYHIVLSKRIKNHLLDNEKIKPGKIIEIKHGLSIGKIQLDKPESDKLIFLAASRFVPEKCLDMYIKAANSLSKKYHDDCDFYMSGTGVEESYLVKLNKSLGDSVKFVDPINEYKSLMAKANIFIFTSIANTEGIPIVVVEALINKCLVICSSYSGYKDIFSDEYSDMIFIKDDLNSLIEKIEYTINNYETLIEKYLPLYDSILKDYSLENMLSLHYELYIKSLNLSE